MAPRATLSRNNSGRQDRWHGYRSNNNPRVAVPVIQAAVGWAGAVKNATPPVSLGSEIGHSHRDHWAGAHLNDVGTQDRYRLPVGVSESGAEPPSVARHVRGARQDRGASLEGEIHGNVGLTRLAGDAVIADDPRVQVPASVESRCAGLYCAETGVDPVPRSIAVTDIGIVARVNDREGGTEGPACTGVYSLAIAPDVDAQVGICRTRAGDCIGACVHRGLEGLAPGR